MRQRWEPAFVGVSLAVGESLEAASRALGDDGAIHAADWLQGLGAGSRDARARFLARVLSDVAVAIDAVRLA
jgi:hypothetical protein